MAVDSVWYESPPEPGFLVADEGSWRFVRALGSVSPCLPSGVMAGHVLVREPWNDGWWNAAVPPRTMPWSIYDPDEPTKRWGIEEKAAHALIGASGADVGGDDISSRLRRLEDVVESLLEARGLSD